MIYHLVIECQNITDVLRFLFIYSFFPLFTVNKQLADKERVAAALENTHLLEVVNQCLAPTTRRIS